MNIQEASIATGISKDMIRFYEKKGLLHPSRNPENHYRDYSMGDIHILVTIKFYSKEILEKNKYRSIMLLTIV